MRWAALPKTQPLLAYLLLNRQAPIARDGVAFLFWDDVPEREARANLRRHLHDLLKALPPASPDAPWLLRTGTTVQWNPAAPYWLDVAEFEAGCRSPHQLAEAVTLYTGSLLPHLYEDWLIQERDRLQMLYLNVLMQLIERERQQGDLPQAQVYAQMLLNHDPLREDAVRQMMTLRYAAGDRAGALQIYQRFVARLAEELDVAPMPETAQLFETISQNKPVDSGVVQNRLAEARTTAVAPHNLPAQLMTFIGRQDETTAVSHLIGQSESPTRLVTITGTGGTGKTRLSLQVADTLRQQQPALFPDGIFFVALASLTEPSQVIMAIADVVGKPVQDGRSPLDSLKKALQNKQLLLILDNFEHLLDGAVEVAELLTAVPGLRLLVTSQAALHLYGEHEFPLDPLPLPEANTVPPVTELLNYAAVALFVSRVQAVQPGFTLSEANREAVVAICQRLDGLPLALELAAARSKLLTPAAMLGQLNQRLRFLTSQARNRPSRHQTLRGAIDWSYSLLTPDEQTLFAGLALFADSFTLSAVAAVFGETEIGDPTDQPDELPLLAEETAVLLASLVDKSMLRLLPPAATDEPETRFRMLQTLREYGLEQLAQVAPETAVAIHQRFARYYAELAKQGRSGLLYSAEQQTWLQRLRAEENNFIVALEWLDRGGDQAANALLLATIVGELSRFWYLRGHLQELQTWMARATSYLPLLPPGQQLHLLNEAGNAAQIRGDYAAAERHHQQALTLAYTLNDERQIAVTLHYVAFATGRQGQYAEAKTLFQECLAYYRGLPDLTPQQLTPVLNNMAIVHMRLGEHEAAITLLEEAITLKRRVGDQIGLPSVLSNVGNLQVKQGRYAAAAASMREALILRQQTQDPIGLCYSLEQLAHLALAQGQYQRAATLFAAADKQMTTRGLPRPHDGQKEYEAALDNLCHHLGKADLASCQAEGARLSLAEAVSYALRGLLPA